MTQLKLNALDAIDDFRLAELIASPGATSLRVSWGDGTTSVEVPTPEGPQAGSILAAHDYEGDGLNDAYRIVATASLPGDATQRAVFTAWFDNLATAGTSYMGSNLGDALYAGSGADSVSGLGGIDLIHGGAGRDTILGGKGDDWLWGGLGNDSINAGDGNDIVYADSPFEPGGSDTVRGGRGNDTLYGGVHNDQLFGDGGDDQVEGDDGNDVIRGGTGNDRLLGGAGNDRMLGDAGDDVIIGGAGVDIMTGGAGRDLFITDADGKIDIFVYAGLDEGGDRIRGFEVAFDWILLPAVLSNFYDVDHFIANSAPVAGGVDGFWVLYETDTGKLSVDTDGLGGDASILLAVLLDRPVLTADNIIFG